MWCSRVFSLQSRDYPRSLRVTGEGPPRLQGSKGREDASVVAIRRKGNYFDRSYEIVFGHIQVCDCLFPRINRNSQPSSKRGGLVGPTSPLLEAPSVRRFSPERYGGCRIPVPTPTPPGRSMSGTVPTCQSRLPSAGRANTFGATFSPRHFGDAKGLRSQHNHMTVTYGGMQEDTGRQVACMWVHK